MFNSKHLAVSFLFSLSASCFSAYSQGIVTTSFDPVTATGTVKVMLEKGRGPFCYLISKQEIPSKEEIYGEFNKLMDLAGKGVKPQTFLPANIKSTEHEFTELEIGKYYVKVWDAHNNVVLENTSAQVAQPLTFAEKQNISISNGMLSTREARGWNSSFGVLDVPFQLNQRDINLFQVSIPQEVPSFLLAAQPNGQRDITSDPEAIQIGLLVDRGKAKLVVKGRAVFTDEITGNEQLVWGFKNGQLTYQKNGKNLFNEPLTEIYPDQKESSSYLMTAAFSSVGSIGFSPLQPINLEPITYQIKPSMVSVASTLDLSN